MKTSEILKTEKIVYTSKQSAKDAIKFITDLTGVKSIECDRPTDYTTFINLSKNILLKSGVELYSIWINNTYINDKLVYRVSLQTNYSLSMSIATFINEKNNANELILTDEMENKLALVNL